MPERIDVDPDAPIDALDAALRGIDARLSPTSRNTVCGPHGLMSRVFCVNCGADGGLITEAWAKSVFYLCDRCEAWGRTPALLEAPENLVRGEPDHGKEPIRGRQRPA